MKKLIFIVSLSIMIFSLAGCSNDKKDSSKSTKANTKTTIKKEKNIAEIDDEDPVEYANANYFTGKVKQIIYYRNGKTYKISPKSKEGKEILLLTKKRYVNTAELALDKNILKNKISNFKKNRKALEIKFTSSSETLCDDAKRIIVNYQSWFYPLDGKESQYFAPLPNVECTLRTLGTPKKLLDYLEKNIVN